MNEGRLLIGVDGGGSKTAACIACLSHTNEIHTLGTGYGGPSNARAVGQAHAEINLNVAIDAAHQSAGTENSPVDYAVLGMAGSSLEDARRFLLEWAKRRDLASKVDIVHDAEPVFAEAIGDGQGIALLIGTGSVAIGRDNEGHRSVTGGWGHWFGDIGSGYDLGRCALAAVADAVDGTGPATSLENRILQRLHTDDPREMLQRLGQAQDIRREIASLAPILLSSASEGDTVSVQILEKATQAAARIVATTIERLDFSNDTPLAVAGGIVSSSDLYRSSLLRHLRILGKEPAKVTVVTDPVKGCLRIARDRLNAMQAS